MWRHDCGRRSTTEDRREWREGACSSGSPTRRTSLTVARAQPYPLAERLASLGCEICVSRSVRAASGPMRPRAHTFRQREDVYRRSSGRHRSAAPTARPLRSGKARELKFAAPGHTRSDPFGKKRRSPVEAALPRPYRGHARQSSVSGVGSSTSAMPGLGFAYRRQRSLSRIAMDSMSSMCELSGPACLTGRC